jgi:MFS family permease
MRSLSEKDGLRSEAAVFSGLGKAWRTVFILFVLAIASFLDRMVISMLVGPIEHDLKLTDTQFSLVQGIAFAAAFAFGAIPLGMAIDRYSRRHIVFICVLCWAAGCISVGFAAGMVSLIAARMLLGLGEAVLTPAASSLIGENFPDDQAATALGVFGASNYAGYGISMALGGALITALSAKGGIALPFFGKLEPWRATFIIVGAPVILLAFSAFFLNDPERSLNPQGPKSRRPVVGWSEVFRTRRFALIALLMGVGCLTGVFSTVTAWSPAYLFRAFHLPSAEIGLALGVGMGVLAPCGSFLSGLAINWMMRSGIRNAAFVVGAVIGVVCGPVFVLADLVNSPRAAIILLNIGLLIFGGMAAVSFNCIQVIAPPGARGKVASLIVLTCAMLSYAVAPLMVALVTDYVLRNPDKIGLSLAIVQPVLCIAGVAGFWVGLPHLKRCASATLTFNMETEGHENGTLINGSSSAEIRA